MGRLVYFFDARVARIKSRELRLGSVGLMIDQIGNNQMHDNRGTSCSYFRLHTV